eukprot:scaffold8477_cov23-Cyclotella_meneghiniana.AAC.3
MSDAAVNIDSLTQFVLDGIVSNQIRAPKPQNLCVQQLCVFHCHDGQVTRACREVRRHVDINNIDSLTQFVLGNFRSDDVTYGLWCSFLLFGSVTSSIAWA